MLRDRVRSVLTVTAVTGALLAGGTATAYAQDGDHCNRFEFCLYENPNYNNGDFNTFGKRQWEQSDLDYNNDKWWDYIDLDHHKTDVLNDEASSVKNRSGCGVYLWEHPGQTGEADFFRPGAEVPRLDWPDLEDNEASSHQFLCH